MRPMRVEVRQPELLFDEPPDVIVSTVPGASVRVRVEGLLPPWRAFSVATEAVYTADSDGRCDLAASAAVGGSFRGIDPFGLWVLGEISRSRVDPSDHWTIVVESQSQQQIATVVRRLAGGDTAVDPVTDDGLVGVYARPARRAPIGAVLVLGGSDAVLEAYADVVVRQLAARGFAALGVSYFGVPGRPPGFARIELEYLEQAVEWLRSQPEVAGRRVAAWGFSVGSGAALLLGSRCTQVAAVVSLGGAITNRSFGPGSGPDVPAWTYRDQAVPFAPLTADSERLMAAAHTHTPVRLGPAFDALSHLPGAADAEFEVEKVSGPIFVVSGGDDAMSGLRGAERIVERGAAHGCNVEHLRLPGAGHWGIAFPPGMPTTTSGVHHITGVHYAHGGTRAANSQAQAIWWPRALRFLTAVLADSL